MCSTPCVVLVRVLSVRPRASCAFAAFWRVIDASSCRLARHLLERARLLARALGQALAAGADLRRAAAATWLVAPATSDSAPSRLSSAVLSESLSLAWSPLYDAGHAGGEVARRHAAPAPPPPRSTGLANAVHRLVDALDEFAERPREPRAVATRIERPAAVRRRRWPMSRSRAPRSSGAAFRSTGRARRGRCATWRAPMCPPAQPARRQRKDPSATLRSGRTSGPGRRSRPWMKRRWRPPRRPARRPPPPSGAL